MRALHSLASFQFTAWLPFCHGEIGLVPRGWFSVNPRWLVVILSININLQICWRKIAKAPNAKKIMPKAGKKILFWKQKNQCLPATCCSNLCWEWVMPGAPFKERIYRLSKSKGAEGLGGREVETPGEPERRLAAHLHQLCPIPKSPSSPSSLPLACHHSACRPCRQL